jgi:hypothetical protein
MERANTTNSIPIEVGEKRYLIYFIIRLLVAVDVVLLDPGCQVLVAGYLFRFF